MNQDKKVVKISDVIESQIPDFILSENPNFAEFLKQYYISQEFQGSSIDLVENLETYKNIETFDSVGLVTSTTLTDPVEFFDDVINVDSTNGWPNEYGLLKIDNEIITYTGITTNSFTGCIRGFSGVESLSDPNNPEFLKFSSSEVSEHADGSVVKNLSNLFLLEFFKKIKYQFTPGFEEFDFDSRINAPNFISKAKDFYTSKGTDEAFKILFKVLYGENVEVIKPKDFLFTPSDGQWIVVERFIAEVVEGNPLNLNGQTLYQDASGSILEASGSIYETSLTSLNGKSYYNIDIFSGFSNNLNPKGSIFGEFAVTPKTYCTKSVEIGSDTINVVSTVGFENSGTLNVGNQVVSYTDKTNTEFLNCSGITEVISLSDSVYATNFVYSYENGNSDSIVKLRLVNTLSSIDTSTTLLAAKDDLLTVDNLGIVSSDTFTKSLIYNVPSSIFVGTVYDTIPVSKFGVSKTTGTVKTKYPHYLKNGDEVEVFSLTTNSKLFDATISNVNDLTSNVFTISDPQNLVLNHEIKVRRKIFTSQSTNYPEITNKFSVNIQGSYEDDENYYVTSNGFPTGNINPYNRQFEFLLDGTDSTLILGNHNFYDGDMVSVVSYEYEVYNTSIGFKNLAGISTGTNFYIKKISSDRIKLCNTRSDVFTATYVDFSERTSSNSVSASITNISLVFSKLYNNELTSTKLFKKVPKIKKLPAEKYVTEPGSVGILVNGMEIQNAKSFDRLYNGKIVDIDVLNSGSGYSLINPPRFSVNYGVDTTTILTPNLTGKVSEILVLDPGFDYVETPIVTISGGNNESLRTSVKMKKIQKEYTFNANDNNVVVVIDPINKFNFGYAHKLIPGDSVVYESQGNTPIPPLVDGAVYYISNIGAGTSFSLYSTKEDAIAGINTVNINSGGTGAQRFISTRKVNVIDSVNVIDVDNEFEYKKLPFNYESINIYDNILTIENHGFSTGEEVSYSFTGTTLPNLVTTSYYYVYVIDSNRFKLYSSKDFTTSPIDLFYDQTHLTSVYYISYSPIRINIRGKLTTFGISQLGVQADLYPVVEGKINSLNIFNSLSTYGSTIFNYQKYPSVEVLKGKSASLKPIISNGKIVDVVIHSTGTDYYNNVEIEVTGSGTGAKLHPVITNGQITDIIIISSGIGYDQYTTLSVNNVGSGAVLKANLQYWNVNETSKYSSEELERGILVGENYYPNKNNIGIYKLTSALSDIFGIVENSHSPIIGWSYDGCPIYGPYAYENSDGSGNIVEMKSSYKLVKNSPTISNSLQINCVEDYIYESGYGTLDEFNGRYCITPEYPNGIYAYFATGAFPFFIGTKYAYEPVSENFILENDQSINFNSLGIIKHTFPYYVEDRENYYEYFDFVPSTSKDDFVVSKITSGQIDSLEIDSPGEGYYIKDKIIFNNEGTSGNGAYAEVNEISGVGISSLTSQTLTKSNITLQSNGNIITGISTNQLLLKDEYYAYISNISDSSYSYLQGNKKINFDTFETKLTEALPANVGLVTSIKISDSITNLDIGSELKIGNEVLSVIGFDYLNNRVNVKRSNESLSYAEQSTVTLLQNKFEFNSNTIANLPEKDEVYYFDSSLISVGTNVSPGSGNTIIKNPLGPGSSETKFVRTAGVWMPNHKFRHGERVKYTVGDQSISPEVNVGFGEFLNSISDLYIVDFGNDIIGFVNDKTKINTYDSLLAFINAGSGRLHKLETQRTPVTCQLTFNETLVSTLSTHGLSVGDIIKLDVTVGNTTSHVVLYDSNQFKVKLNSQNNPKITAYRNEIVEFNLSSSTLQDTEFKLYYDENFENEYFGSETNGLEVIKESNKLTLKINSNTPSKLYYNLESDSKQIYNDFTVENYNTIEILPSVYNTTSKISGISSNTFSVNLQYTPERSAYTSIGQTSLSYSVLESNTSGPIKDVRMIFNGKNYQKLPSVVSIGSSGVNGKLIPVTKNIGKIVEIENIYSKVYPSDKTVKPNSKLYSTLYLKNNYKVDRIDLISGGANYLSPPEVKVYNQNTNEISDSFSAYAELSGSKVSNIVIVNPGHGMPESGNILVFTNNSNGLKILEAYRTQPAPNNFLVTLRVETPTSGFTTSNPIPFKVNDKIFVEGLVGSGSGYNSSDHNYTSFNVVGVVTSYSSQNQALVRYELSSDPGSILSYEFAYVMNDNDLPKANVYMVENSFISNEELENTRVVGNLTNPESKSVVKVKDSSKLAVGQNIKGKSSYSEGQIIKKEEYKTQFEVSSSKSKSIGSLNDNGNLSSISQKLPDNDYYQNFSYSLRSVKQISDWDSAVSDLSHISGLKKFSDLIVESTSNIQHEVTSDNNSIVNISLDSYVNVNTVHDFDLVLENVDENDGLYSDTLKFRSKKLTDYIVSIGNRVLSIDDISLNFDNDSTFLKITVDTLPTFGAGSFISKYFTFIESTRSIYTDFEIPLLAEVYVSRRGSSVNLLTYSYFEDVPLGTFISEVNPQNNNEVLLQFVPTAVNNLIAASTIKDIVPLDEITTEETYGNLKNIGINTSFTGESTPTEKVINLISTSECNSGNIYVGIATVGGYIEEFFESSFLYNGQNIITNTYSESEINDLGVVGLRTDNSNNIVVSFTPTANKDTQLYINASLLVNTNSSPEEISLEYGRLNSSSVSFTAANLNPVGITTIGQDYGASKYAIEVKKTVGLTTEVNFIQINSVHYIIDVPQQKYLNNINYGIIGNFSDLEFETTFDEIAGSYTLSYKPSSLANYEITFYEKNILRQTNPLL